MIEMKCECYCGCGAEEGDMFQCCDLWFCSECFADHVEDMFEHDN